MLTQAEQRKAAKEFAKRWEGVGYEKGDSATFWLVAKLSRSDFSRVPGTFTD